MDAELSSLERACRERPDDAKAGLAYAAALARIESWPEWTSVVARLARSGHEDAATLLDEREPRAWPRAAAFDALRDPVVVAMREHAQVGGSPVFTPGLAGRTAPFVMLGACDEVRALDAMTLEVLWRADAINALPTCVERVLLRREGELRLCDARSGAVLAVERVAAAGATVLACGDRVFVWTRASPSVEVLGVEAHALRVLDRWDVTRGVRDVAVAGSRAFLLNVERTFEARSLETGDLLWSRPFELQQAPVVIAADRHGAVVQLERPGIAQTIAEHDAATGELRWATRGNVSLVQVIDRERAIVGDDDHEFLVDRRTGSVTTLLRRERAVACAYTRDARVSLESRNGRLVVAARALVDGAALWTLDLLVDGGDVARGTLLVCKGAVLVVARRPAGGLVAFRIEERERGR